MKNRTLTNQLSPQAEQGQDIYIPENKIQYISVPESSTKSVAKNQLHNLAEILFVTSYPPRECGIATYSQDLIKALNNKFSSSMSIKVCALESVNTSYDYPPEVKYILKTSIAAEYEKMATRINSDSLVKTVVIQHEFGFYQKQEHAFTDFVYNLSKPVVIVFHTVLPGPDENLKMKVRNIAAVCESLVVMTHTSAELLINEYGVSADKITVIAHGTHLVPSISKKALKQKYNLLDRKVLTTFGLLGSGKGIETTIEALPAIVKASPEVMFLVIGKTHPEVVKEEGEKYREMLEQKVIEYSLQDNVRFVNSYLPLPDLLEYLQLTDVYLFTTNDPNQAVSGTFVYAMSCGCPIISTPIPHAKELLTKSTGIIFDFRDSKQLATSVIRLLRNDKLRKNMSINTLHKIVSTAWENSAIAHAMLFEKITEDKILTRFNLPEINLSHLKHMTTQTGIIQFAKINRPDIKTGYTLDDNARAMVASCMYLKHSGDRKIISEIRKYLKFISFCQQPEGDFLNYVDKELHFTSQNEEVNLEDSNGRAIWALGYLVTLSNELPAKIIKQAATIFEKATSHLESIHSTRSMAFTIKGLCYFQQTYATESNLSLIKTLADRLVKMYKHESDKDWNWFESYLTYANSILPEALLYAWKHTGNKAYKEIAVESFNFLLSQIFNERGIEVISNRNWLQKGKEPEQYGEQPIDVAYTIMALSEFYDELMDKSYLSKMTKAFNWFLGDNRLHHIVYNPSTGGCYDGLEETHANLNQGAESTVSYLMARFTMQKYENEIGSASA